MSVGYGAMFFLLLLFLEKKKAGLGVLDLARYATLYYIHITRRR